MIDLPFTMPSLRKAYAQGLSPNEVIGEVYRRIEAVDDPGVFIHLRDADDVLIEAAALGAFDPAKPLFGIPFAIKDNIDAAGLPTTAACPAFAYVAEKDAFVVAKLRAAGALLLGKTNLDQFATGLVGVRSPYPIPKNAIDSAIVPGGSSSGSAVAVAHGMVSFALGTDTAGSGRVPAALNNIVGLKPTLGALSASGLVPACRTLDTISIFALTVDDAYDALLTAAGFDAEDAYSRPIRLSPLGAPPPAFRLGIPNDQTIRFDGDLHQGVSFEKTVEDLKAEGAEIVPLDFAPLFELAAMLYQGAWVAERFAVIEELLKTAPDEVLPVTRKIIGHAETMSAADAFRDVYKLQEMKRDIEGQLQKIDLFAVPSIPSFCSLAEIEADPITPNNRLGAYTNFVNLLDLAGIAVPTGPRGDGRPGGVTLLARAGRDDLIASIGRNLHQLSGDRLGATDWPCPASEAATPTAGSGEFTIAVCGAHMSSLPLNHELTSRGARFLRQAETAPGYRLYALAGGPPARPGLVGVTEGDGRPIEVEIWTMPLAEVGGFLQGVPAPLGLGTLQLADGSTCQGFLCEQAGLKDARDISALGGWRAFLAAQSAPSDKSKVIAS